MSERVSLKASKSVANENYRTVRKQRENKEVVGFNGGMTVVPIGSAGPSIVTDSALAVGSMSDRERA